MKVAAINVRGAEERPPMPKILVVGRGYPWGGSSGGPMRIAGILRILSQVGTVTYLALLNSDQESPSLGSKGLISEVLALTLHRRHAAWAWLRWSLGVVAWKRAWVPRNFFYWKRGTLPEGLALENFDIVWICEAESAYLLQDSLRDAWATKTVVDLYDLHEQRLEQQARQLSRDPRISRLPLSWAIRRFLLVEAESWRRWERRVAERALAVTVTKDEDRIALGKQNVAVIPNGYPTVPPRPSREPRAGITLLFQGAMNYPPNIDAAFFIAEEIVPALERRIGSNFQVRIVGKLPRRRDRLRIGRDITSIASAPHVRLTGYVEDLSAELDNADIALVPLRQGSGTRIKILEAWAHRIPVVSTAIGAEGLGARAGKNILIAETADEFAEAVHVLLNDKNLGGDLASRAHQLFLQQYSWDAVSARIASLLRDLLSSERCSRVGSRT